MVKLLKIIIFKSYVIFLMAFTVWYGFFMYPLVFGFEGKKEAELSLKKIGHAGTEQELLFVNLISSRDKIDTTNLGHRIINQPYIEGRFHHIAFESQQDKTSSCIRCHGNTPHNKSKEVRSFLNMHAFYTACETCHIRPEGGDTALSFRWYDKDTGEATVNPKALVDIEHEYSHYNPSNYPTYGNYGAKIAPGRIMDGEFYFLKDEKDLEFVERYIKEDSILSEQQKSQMKRIIHKEINKKPIECNSCHQELNSYIPFAELGYPPRRTDELTNTSVVGMIDKYKEFYIPNFLSTGQQ